MGTRGVHLGGNRMNIASSKTSGSDIKCKSEGAYVREDAEQCVRQFQGLGKMYTGELMMLAQIGTIGTTLH